MAMFSHFQKLQTPLPLHKKEAERHGYRILLPRIISVLIQKVLSATIISV